MDGLFLDGWSLADRPVRVALRDGELAISDIDGAPLRSWPIAGLHMDAMQEGDTYHLTHTSAPHEELVLKNPALARELLAATKSVAALPGGRHKLLFGVACLLALAALMGGLYAVAPKLAHFIAVRIPLEHERALGAELEVILSFDRCENAAAEKLLDKVVATLAGPDAPHYQVRMLGMPEPNAFALPGGVVLVTAGFLEQAESGDEILGVLAHEVEHITQRHVLAGAVRDVFLTALWSVTFGDYSGLMMVDPSTAYRIANLEFSRDDEQAADRGAVARLHRIGARHHGLVSFFERLAKKYGSDDGPSLLSTHPSTATRIRALKAVPDLEHPRYVLSDAELATLRSGCGASDD